MHHAAHLRFFLALHPNNILILYFPFMNARLHDAIQPCFVSSIHISAYLHYQQQQQHVQHDNSCTSSNISVLTCIFVSHLGLLSTTAYSSARHAAASIAALVLSILSFKA